MKRSWMKAMCNLFTLSALVAGMQACAADSSDSDGEPSATEGGLVATIPLENGNTLDFHDLGSAAVIAERGEAYTPHLYKPSEGESLTAVWSRFARGAAVPKELVALQRRLETTEATEPATDAPTATVGVQETPTFGDSPGTFNKSHCGNGCCNRQWLLDTFPICNPGAGQIFQFDKVSPWMDVEKVWSMQSFVCAASPVKYEITIDGRTTFFNVNIAEATTFNVIRPKRNQNPFAKPYFYYHVRAVARTVGSGTATHCFAHSKF
ncbi:MAG TPA: hypothetical protein VJU61_02080 [Polyangiaceae bacterium]|nr:hypothetical protein [Polyangiaceae bacterium]